jgi:VCBS repeat-containing protein
MAEAVPLKISNQIIVTIDGVTKGDGSDHIYSFSPPGASRPVSQFHTWDGQGVSQNSLPGGEKNVEYGPFTIEFAGVEIFTAAHQWLLDSVEKGAEVQKTCTVAVNSAEGTKHTYNFAGCECQSVQPSPYRAGDTSPDTYTLTVHPTTMTIE